jgi:hypothetical protein
VSRTTTISCGERVIYAFDEARAILLKYLLETVEPRIQQGTWLWMADEVDDWRVAATVGDFDWTLGPWTAAQQDEFADAAHQACLALAGEPQLQLATIAQWTLLDNRPLVQRLALWDDPIDTQPIVELGEAVVQLLRDTLPPPPPHARWLYGFRGGRRPMTIDSSAG